MKPNNETPNFQSLSEKLSQLIMVDHANSKSADLDFATINVQIGYLEEYEKASFNCDHKPNTHTFVRETNRYFSNICDKYLANEKHQTVPLWNNYVRTLQKEVNTEQWTYVSDEHLKPGT